MLAVTPTGALDVVLGDRGAGVPTEPHAHTAVRVAEAMPVQDSTRVAQDIHTVIFTVGDHMMSAL